MALVSKLRTNQYEVNPDNNQLTFLDSRLYQHENGEYYPSVTTVLECFPKDAYFYKWLKENGENADKIRDAAGERGSMVHKLTELYDAGEEVSLMNENGKIDYSLEEWSMFERYVDFSEKFQPHILKNEFQIISPTLKIGMTIDRNVIVNDMNLIVDIKTSNTLNDSYWAQLAAYHKAFIELYPDSKIDNIAVLWLNSKTRTEGKTKGAMQGRGWQMLFPEKPIEYYWELFKHAQALWEFKNEGYKPRHISYNLKYKK